jgi:hypothetical protein
MSEKVTLKRDKVNLIENKGNVNKKTVFKKSTKLIPDCIK